MTAIKTSGDGSSGKYSLIGFPLISLFAASQKYLQYEGDLFCVAVYSFKRSPSFASYVSWICLLTEMLFIVDRDNSELRSGVSGGRLETPVVCCDAGLLRRSNIRLVSCMTL